MHLNNQNIEAWMVKPPSAGCVNTVAPSWQYVLTRFTSRNAALHNHTFTPSITCGSLALCESCTSHRESSVHVASRAQSNLSLIFPALFSTDVRCSYPISKLPSTGLVTLPWGEYEKSWGGWDHVGRVGGRYQPPSRFILQQVEWWACSEIYLGIWCQTDCSTGPSTSCPPQFFPPITSIGILMCCLWLPFQKDVTLIV